MQYMEWNGRTQIHNLKYTCFLFMIRGARGRNQYELNSWEMESKSVSCTSVLTSQTSILVWLLKIINSIKLLSSGLPSNSKHYWICKSLPSAIGLKIDINGETKYFLFTENNFEFFRLDRLRVMMRGIWTVPMNLAAWRFAGKANEASRHWVT